MQNLEVLAQKMAKLELFLSSVQIRCGAAAEGGGGGGKTQFYCLDTSILPFSEANLMKNVISN